MKSKRKGQLIGLIAAAVLLWGGPGWAQDATWQGGTGNWNVGSNWAGGTVPLATDNALVDGGAAGDSVVTVTTAATINDLIISIGDTVSNNTLIFTLTGNLSNDGTFALNSSGSTTSLDIADGSTFSGTGTVSLNNNPNNRITGNAGALLTNAAGHTIAGTGNIGAAQLVLNNAGLIAATQPNALTLNLQAGSTSTNTGTLRAEAGRTLTLSTGGTGFTVDNTGGLIEALDGAQVQLRNGIRVEGGTLATSGTGFIRLESTTLDGVTNTGLTQVTSAGARLAGTIVNDGELRLNSFGSATSFSIEGDVRLEGSGALTATSFAANTITSAFGFPDSVLTNTADHTIRGSGALGAGTMGLINEGLILADQSAQLTVNLSNTVAQEHRRNTGTMRAENGATLAISSTVLDNTGGLIEARGTDSFVRLDGTNTRIIGGTLNTQDDRTIVIFGGSALEDLRNDGNVRVQNANTGKLKGTIENFGEIAVASSGTQTTLQIEGDTTLTGDGQLRLTNNSSNRIIGVPVTSVLTNDVDHLITGSGSLGVNNLGLINLGTIEADGSAGLTVNLNNDAGVARQNQGTMRALDGSTLTVTDTDLDNSGGSIQAQTGGTVSFTGTNTRITGGVLTGDGDFDLRGSATLVDLRNEGRTAVANVQTGRLEGAIDNAGVIALDSTGSTTTLTILDDTTLSGGGVLEMSNNFNNRITGSPATSELTNAADHTIRGAGQIGIAGNMGLINEGLIEAVGSAGLTVLLNTDEAVTRSNTGTLRATDGATLTLGSSAFNMELANAGGLIEAQDGGTVVIAGSRILGGVLDTGGTGVIDLRNSGVLSNLRNDGLVQINNVASGRLQGTVENFGEINLNSSGSFTSLQMLGDVTLTGTGLLSGSNFINNAIFGTPTTTLTQTADHTIRGAFNIGNSGNMALANAGVIEAQGSAGITMNLSSEEPNSNSGEMRALTGSALRINSTVLDNTGGLIEAADGAVVTITGGRIDGGRIDTDGTGVIDLVSSAVLADLRNDGFVRVDNGRTGRLSGAIENFGTISIESSGSATTIDLAEDTTLSGTGTLVMGDATNNRLSSLGSDKVLTNAAGHTIRGSGSIGFGGGSIGLNNAGLIEADGTVALTINPNASLGSVVNTGTMRASGAGGLSLTGGSYVNQGLIEAVDGSTVSYSTSGITLNNIAGTLTGGQWRAAGNGSTIDIRGGQVVTNDAEIILSGAGSQFRAFQGTGFVALEDSLTTNQGTLRILDNRDYSTSNDLTNSGLLQLGGGTLDANSLTNTDTGILTGYGTVTPRPVNSGLIEATGGTLAMTGGIQGGSGTVTIQPDGALDLSSATQASSADFLNHQGTAPDSLNLGGNDFIVSQDYTNANFGEGNTFDARANVVGTGQIVGENADMAITGDVAAAGANTVTLDLGNVRGETSTTVNYQIENSGTGADIRGAVQTAAGTGNITDARLSGSGVDAQNFGPIAAGQNSGDLSVTFTATSGGSLDGQTIGVVSNFDNVAGQTIQITGMATSLAEGSATPTGPIDLGNFRVGQDGPSQSFDVANLTTGSGAEKLGIGTADTTGNFAATNSLGAGLIDGGASQTNALSAAVNNGQAGENTGTLGIQYTTDGTHIDAGFTAQDVNSQTVALSATGYNMAQGSATPDPVTLANQRVGGTESQALTVSNTAPSGTFTEGLNAGFGASTGDATDNSGSIGLLAGGDSNNSAMSVGVDTSAAGARTGSVTLNYETDGTGTSGLAAESVGSQTINVSGNVYQTATPTFAQTDVNLGNVRVGDTASSALGVTNTDNAPAGFQESLNAGFSATTGDATASGTIAQLTQGSSDTTSLVVGLDTTTAGARSGTATVDLVSTGVGTSGLADLSLGSQAITVSGNVFQVAEGNLNTTSLNFGVVQVGQSVSQNLSISNIATGPSGFVEDLNAQFGAASGTGSNLISGSGMISGLLAGGTDTTSMVVNVNTASAGTVNGAIAVDYFSAGAVDGVSNGLGTLAVGSQDFGVTGTIQTTATVVDQAAPVINTAQPILLGNVREGAVSPTAVVSVTNVATGNQQADLNAAITGNAPITATGSFDKLGPGATDASSLQVGMNTTTAGAIAGTATIGFVSDAGNLGGGQLTLASQDVQVQGAVYRLAQGDTDPDPVAFGNLRINTSAEQALTISNTAANDGYSEVLNAAFGTATGDAGDNAGAVNQLAAGGSDASNMVASLDTSVAGVRGGTVTVDYASDGTGTTGEAAISVGSQSIDVTGTVYRLASPNVDTAQPVVLAARVGDAAPTQNLSVTNQSPDAFTEGLKADIDSVDAGFAGSGSIDNLTAGGTDSTSLTVGLADTSTSQNISGNVNLEFQSTGAGTTGAADIAVGSEAVQVQGRVYQQAEAQVNTSSVNFGIVHVGDVVGAQTVSVTNATPAAVLNDTLAGGFVNLPAGPFDGSGSVSGLGAGQTDAANLAIGLDTSSAGIFDLSGQYLQFASQNPDMADLDLGTRGLDLFAQVNNFANPVFDILSGPGSLTRTGNLFEFSLGTVLDTSGPFSIELGLFNDTTGPADFLAGTFDFSGTGDFGITGSQTFSNLDAGDFTSFVVNFNPMSLGLGSFSEMVTLDAMGSNASGFQQLFSLDLRLSANVAPIPEPGTMALLAMGLLLLGLAARRGYLRR